MSVSPRPGAPRAGLRTYSHLLAARRVPTEYEIASSRLLYYTERGFEVTLPMAEFYRQHQQGSRLRSADWERFRDPRETTYPRYTALMAGRETFVDGLLESAGQTGYDLTLGGAWLALFESAFAPLRYPFHGLQMVAAYIGQMAPSGRIAMVALFQAADEVRRIQHIAHRIAGLRQSRGRPGFCADGMTRWLEEPAWQPLRETVERLLVTFDWGEAFAGLNLCVKPALDELMMVRWAEVARDRGDYVLAQIVHSLEQDCRWQRDWTAALARFLCEADPDHRRVLAEWIGFWRPPALRAAASLGELWGDARADTEARISARLDAFAESAGLCGGPAPRGAP